MTECVKGIRRFRKTFAVLLALSFCFAAVPPEAHAESIFQISVNFADPGCSEVWSWEFPWSDEWFLEPEDVFNRELAKGSMGLTVSAFRPTEKTPDLEPQYETYLSGAGFEKIHMFGYDQPIGTDTFAGIIGRKEFEGFTLIAVAGRGTGYGKEWGGNLRLGNGIRHEGFDLCAKMLEEELDSYLAEDPAKGPVKIWITGYSRSAAVGNLAAADWTASGRFDAVYGYFFACPRNTLEPLRTPNIFNICGAQDFVTQIPMQNYGYERNGTDLFLPSQETESDYVRMKDTVSETSMRLTGRKLVCNPELSLYFRLAIGLLAGIFPTQDEYVTLLQDRILSNMPEGDIESAMEMLPGMAASILTLQMPEGQTYFTTALGELITEITMMLTLGKQSLMEAGLWDPDASAFVNVFREHLTSTYVCWLFSDLQDSEILHETSPERILFVDRCSSLAVSRNNDPLWILENGKVQKTKDEAAGYAKEISGTVMLILPTDADYRLSVSTETGTLRSLEIQITPERTLSDTCICYLSDTLQAGAYELTAHGTEPLTDVAHAETACTADDLVDMACLGFSGNEGVGLVNIAFGK